MTASQRVKDCKISQLERVSWHLLATQHPGCSFVGGSPCPQRKDRRERGERALDTPEPPESREGWLNQCGEKPTFTALFLPLLPSTFASHFPRELDQSIRFDLSLTSWLLTFRNSICFCFLIKPNQHPQKRKIGQFSVLLIYCNFWKSDQTEERPDWNFNSSFSYFSYLCMNRRNHLTKKERTQWWQDPRFGQGGKTSCLLTKWLINSVISISYLSKKATKYN
jgi:hypothetical protein